MGDATEIEALSAFFRPLVEPGRRIAVGSVKSNIGHTLETAGLASLLKVLLAMQHGQIPPTIHLREPNRTIPWSELPFSVPTKTEPWPAPSDGNPRLAAVNAFGIGGLNMHVVVEEFVRQPVVTAKAATRGETVNDGGIAVIGRGVVLPVRWALRPCGRSWPAVAMLLASRPRSVGERESRWK